MSKGRVYKGVGGFFYVYGEGKSVVCKARKKTGFRGEVVTVGDYVEYEEGKDYAVIDRVLEPFNRLIRPAVSNVDVLVILLAPLPEPDYLLADKLTVNAFKNGIEPYVAVNKTDIADESFIRGIISDYEDFACGTLCFSSVTGEGTEEFRRLFKGKTVVLAGQSAVGKTSLLNRLTGLDREVGELSAKTERGRHTTRHNEIYMLEDGLCIADTAGFSVFTETEVPSNQLAAYYPEMVRLGRECKVRGCVHVHEPGCAVKKAAEEGLISPGRYKRYVELYKLIREEEKNNYRK